jgi:TrmH family RNA methyltransferase
MHPANAAASSPHPLELLALIRTLKSRAERERTQLFFAEGLRFVIEALHASPPEPAGHSPARPPAIQAALFAAPALEHPPTARLIGAIRRRGLPAVEVSVEQFLGVSTAETQQWLGVVCRQRWSRLSEARPGGLCWLAVERIRSAGNLGTLLRSAEAVGAAGLILLGPTADPYDPGCVRGSMGALFSQRLVRASLPELLAWKRRHRCQLVGTSPHAACGYRAVRYRRPTVLLVGAERQGLPPEYQAACDLRVSLPMVGRADSLNVAVAASVMLYELLAQSDGSATRHRRQLRSAPAAPSRRRPAGAPQAGP